ncbi:MAG: riboflavin synthase [Sphingobacteriales bacterium]|nr:MAG: riboflavin synthase [Sphingobacteriales bacterium]TAF81630.1 MAG: riboflavin synthase [Sphingobacteriales bacterium]
MFTGIIETLGKVSNIVQNQSNIDFEITSDISGELKIDQSVAHNGVCLTVVNIHQNTYKVTAINETLQKTNLSKLQIGDRVNIERCMQINGRLDGHIVQGHVDTTAICTQVLETDGSWLFTFTYKKDDRYNTVEKGSVCVNGISLTVVNSQPNSFSVAIIPYTYAHTNLKNVGIGDTVNLEFDIIGKYVAKLMAK